MAGDVVKTEREALRELRNAVTLYAARLRDAMDAARRDVTALVKRAEETERRRHRALDRALGDLRHAQEALAACRDPGRAAPLQRAVSVASARVDEARQLHGYGVKAVRQADSTRSDLSRTMQVVDAAISGHVSVATKALADIENRLAEIGADTGHGHGRHAAGASVRRVLSIGATAAEITLAMTNTGKFGQLVGSGYEIVDGHQATISEISGELTQRQQEFYADARLKETEDHSGKVPKS
jgi:hypothetical protein